MIYNDDLSEIYSKICTIVVDMQEFYRQRDNWHERNISNVKEVIDVSRKNKIPIIHLICTYHKTNDSLGLVSGISPSKDEYVVEKQYNDGFYETNLHDILAELGAETLIMIGGNLCACLYSTFLAAKDRYGDRYKVMIPIDATVCEMGKKRKRWCRENICEYPHKMMLEGGIITDVDSFLEECLWF